MWLQQDPEVLENLRSQVQEAQLHQESLMGQMDHALRDIDVNSGRLQVCERVRVREG